MTQKKELVKGLEKEIINQFKTTKKFLKEDPGLAIMKSDKENNTVVCVQN